MPPPARCFFPCCRAACSAAVAAPTCCCRALTWERFSRRLRRIGYGAMAGKSSLGNGFAGCCHRLGRGGRGGGGGVWGFAGGDEAGRGAARWGGGAADGRRFAAIPTVYVHAAGVRLPQPM